MSNGAFYLPFQHYTSSQKYQYPWITRPFALWCQWVWLGNPGSFLPAFSSAVWKLAEIYEPSLFLPQEIYKFCLPERVVDQRYKRGVILSSPDHLKGIRLVKSGRLITNYVLANTQSFHGNLRVQIRRAQYEDQVHIFLQEDVINYVGGKGDVEAFGCLLGVL